MLIDHWAVARQIQEDTGLSAADILKLDMDEYAKLSQRPTPAQAALEALGYADESPAPQPPAAPQSLPQPLAHAPQGVDVSQLSMEQYAAVRGQLGVGGREYGTGIMNQSGSQSWAEAARAKSGRTGLNNSNVQEPPQIGRAFIEHTQVAGRQSWYRGN